MANDFVSTTELLQLADGNISDISVSELLEDAPLIAAMAAITASNETSHEWLKKTQAPVVGYRSVNDGREVDHAEYTKVTQALALFDASFDIDVALLKSASGSNLQRREAIDHLQAAFASFEKQVIYGTGNDAAGFNGLANEASLAAFDDSMVVDAGGTTASTGSSVWMLRTGESATSLVYGAGGRIEVGESYMSLRDGSATGQYDAERTPILFWAGVQVATSLDAARIINLTEDSGKGLTDDLLGDALSLFPAGRQPNVIAMNRRSLKQLQQSRVATNPTGAPAPRPTSYEGMPIVVTDQIDSTEAISA